MEQHIVEAIITLVSVFGVSFMGYVSKAVWRYITHKHLQSIALQAVHYAEDAFKAIGGKRKLEAACEWASKEMKHYHIKIDEAQIEGAVRAAYTIFVQATEKELKKEA